MLNTISQHPDFVASSLDEEFQKTPLSFIDIGSVGGVHPLILPFASRTRCSLFEPDPVSCRGLRESYEAANPFSELTIHNIAVAGASSRRRLYVTKSPVNTSLLKPQERLARRYDIPGLEIDHLSSVKTDSLSSILFPRARTKKTAGEFIKIDSQGAEMEILQGASRTLRKETVVILCEIVFSPIYQLQKTFSEVDRFLADRGFTLYSLEPHFISSKRLDRREYETEERLLWADALYFKDPLTVPSDKTRRVTRQIQVLFLAALLTHYYDYALEILDIFDWGKNDRRHLTDLVLSRSHTRKTNLEHDVDILTTALRKSPSNKFLQTKKFLDAHRSNSNIDFVSI
jgi:FkbM family methyltransferase